MCQRGMFIVYLWLQFGISLCFKLNGPTFTTEPPHISEFSNSSGTVIPCTASGNPAPAITWTKNENEVVQDIPGIRHVRRDGALVFSPFTPDEYRPDIHSVIYRCIASNSFGAIASRNVHVRAVISQRYEIYLVDEYVLKGNMALLRCSPPSYVKEYIRVTAWERVDGFLITPDVISGKYGMLDDGNLYFRDVRERDATFSFRCHTENIITREKIVSSNYSKVIVMEPQYNQQPRIVHSLSKVKANAGHHVSLFCIAQGHPVPKYQWYKTIHGQRIMSGIGVSAKQEDGVLKFSNVKLSDAGFYSCQVTNSIGEDRVDIELLVEEPLKVSIIPKELQLNVGKDGLFNCSVEGQPFDSIFWKKDTRFIGADSRILFPSPTILQVTHLRGQDSGMYQCFVQRESYSSQATARLLVGDLSPQFKLTFPEKTVRPGSFISLLCITSGNPTPQVKWTLDDVWTLSTRPGIAVSTYLSPAGDVFSYVNITSADVMDSGLYSCVSFNEAGRSVHSRRLNVFGSVFIRPLNNLTALAGGTFKVFCPFGGYPYNDIIWKKEGETIANNQRQHVYQNGTLLISEMSNEDGGLYSCEVRSSQSAPVSRTFRISIKNAPKIANFSFHNNLYEGKRTAVTCIIVEGDGPISTTWLKDGIPFDANDLGAVLTYADENFVSTLTFKNLTYNHNGNYTCVARNEVASTSHSAVLVVRVPPRWIIKPTNVTAVAGRPVKIECQADGVPLPHVRWKMSSSGESSQQFKTIVSRSHVHILMNGSLNFQNVEILDSGYYMCEASNGVGSGITAVVYLSVHSVPRFHTKYAMMTVRRGDKALMDCEVVGDKPISFSWRKNGAAIDTETEIRYSQKTHESVSGARSELVIEKVEKKDSALFSCTAANQYGDDSKNIQLTIQDIPDAPKSTEVHDVSSRSVRLSWSKPFDGNSPIIQYTVMWRQLGGENTGGPVTVPGHETSLVIRGLKPKNRYFFRVKCENSLGESQFGAEVAVTTLEEPPKRAPYGVKVSAVSSRSINVTWQVSRDDDIESVDGFYIGYKPYIKSEPYNFKAINASFLVYLNFILTGLSPLTDYSVIVQSYNSRGAGPPSEPVIARTLEFDKPESPAIKTYYSTTKSIKISWDSRSTPTSPVAGYILCHKKEGNDWHEIRLPGDRNSYTLHDLQCGTSYSFYLIAFNSAGRSNDSEILSAKTDGVAPITPDKDRLLTVSSTSVFVNLSSWHNGGCPITVFVIQYRASGQQEWTLVSNNIVPEQQNITITDLIPGTWYTLLITARNDAGATDSEYIFATLTLSGEYPPHPAQVREMSSTIYRHLIITVPVVSSVIVLCVVLSAVCIITRRRANDVNNRASTGFETNDTVKPENLQLPVRYDSSQEAAYYASSRVLNYNDQCIQNSNLCQKNTGTLQNTRHSYNYDIPYVKRKSEKCEGNYESPTLYFQAYHHSGIETRFSHGDRIIYSESKRIRNKRSIKGNRESNGNTEAKEDLRYIARTTEDRIFRDDSRESETECDRLWKTYESCQYEETKRWTPEHTILS
ncbi:cell adhesion molecule Dscam1 isoform X2 [Parasteatoda tepidariorum]|uniref:cell adhesion molecule Dscam1 isoform X1 n=1 Tax=Parasteatoda tepidariorum TaxID=114398 RepID=UPI001C719081|nr:Down syndrome cell adhesion molecule-like protein Dscam2 isoform X1 [Parasteatoda tepidariorum]XP_042896901.1 Down syndrome cell adhesion molecule-like protein Dscam2 isoform X2 [Parasteatoda tepidariorum]